MPARVEYLANLYVELREQLYSHPKPLIHGFSIYEVNGAFRGTERVFEERTAIIRIIVDAPSTDDESDQERRAHENRIGEIAELFLTITDRQEEEVWMMRIPAMRTVVGS